MSWRTKSARVWGRLGMKCEWNIVRLSDILQDKGYIRGPFGSALKRGDMKDSGIPVYEQQHAIYNTRIFRYFIDSDKFTEMKRFQVQSDDLIISCSGTVGKVSIIQDDDPKGIISQALLLLRVDKSKILPLFLKYFFISNKGYNAIVSRSSGSVQVNIAKRNVIEQIPISLPPIDTQKKIVTLLGRIDDKIELNNAINKNLGELLYALYDNAVATSDSVNEVMLSTLCNFQEGYVNPAQTHPEYFDGDVKWLRAVDINESFIIDTSRTLTKAGFESAKKSALLFKPNTIAISKSGTIGRLGIIADYMCGNRAVINIVPHDTNMLPLIYCFLKSKQREFPNMAVGSVQKNLYVSLLEPLKVTILDDDFLDSFNSIASSLLDAIHNNCLENSKLVNLRDIILPRLMSGELDVSDIEF